MLVTEASVHHVSQIIISLGFLHSTSISKSSNLLLRDVALVYQQDREPSLSFLFTDIDLDIFVVSNPPTKGLVQFPFTV